MTCSITNNYEQNVLREVIQWQRHILDTPSPLNDRIAKWQKKINGVIPGKIHGVITSVYKHLCRVVIFGSKITTDPRWSQGSLRIRETAIKKRIKVYTTTAAAQGGLIGAGGIFLGFADIPLLLGIKIKLLFEIAAIYGFRTGDYKERLFILYVFLLSFSSQEKRREVYRKIENWTEFRAHLPDDINNFDWRVFQEEYRNYTDLMKLPQLIPIIGAPFGAVINFQLTNKLGKDAMNAYRLRWFQLQTPGQAKASETNGISTDAPAHPTVGFSGTKRQPAKMGTVLQ